MKVDAMICPNTVKILAVGFLEWEIVIAMALMMRPGNF